jgi:hypothetical protein
MKSTSDLAKTLRKKIGTIIQENNSNVGGTLDRNILIILTYFGMVKLSAPTLEETGSLFLLYTKIRNIYISTSMCFLFGKKILTKASCC